MRPRAARYGVERATGRTLQPQRLYNARDLVPAAIIPIASARSIVRSCVQPGRAAGMQDRKHAQVI